MEAVFILGVVVGGLFFGYLGLRWGGELTVKRQAHAYRQSQRRQGGLRK